MSEVKVNKISPRSGTTVTLGDSGDTISIPSGVTLANSGTIDNLNASNLTSGTVPDARITGAYTGITNLTMSGDLTVDTNTLFVDASENKVGVGTTTPLENLTVESSSFPIVAISNNSASNPTNGVALDLIERSTSGAVFGQNGVFGFRQFLDAQTNRFDIISGNQTTTNIRLSIERDTGNVGIGTTSPSATLHVDTSDSGVTPSVNADDLFVESSGSTGITIGSGTANFGRINFGDSGDANIGIIQYEHTTNAFAFTTNASERMRIDSSGKVGINNSAPSTELEVYGTIKAHEKSGLAQASILIDALATGNPHLAFQQAGAYKGYIHYLDASDTICLNDGSGNGLHYSPSQQKLGIGTSSPSSYYANHLVVDIGSTAQSGITIVADSSNQAMLAFADGTSGDTRYRGYLDYNHSNDSLAFASAGTERMRIDSSGNVGIGITSLQVPFEVNQTTTEFSHFGSNSVSILNRFTGISLGYAELGNTNYRKIKIAAVGLGDGSARQDLKFLVRTAGDGNSAGLGDSKLSISGTTGIVSGDLNDTSDIGFKENITNITDSLTLVKQLKPRFFTWKDAKAERGNSTGFIAQEVEEIIPLLVQGNDLGSTITGDDGSQSQDMSGKSINTIGLVAHLTKALQEQQTKIEELETRITTLEANNP